MRFLVKVRVDVKKLAEFGEKLQRGELDRRLIVSDTYCLADDPEVGYSVWEAENKEVFEAVFSEWKRYYLETTVTEVISAHESMKVLSRFLNKH